MASTIKVTNIDTPDGTGNITVDRPLSGSGASLTSLPAGNLTGTVADARVPASAVTQHVTQYDDASIRADILQLALNQAIADNRVAFNLDNSFVDGFEDDTGITTETDVDRDTSGEYVATNQTGEGRDSYTSLLVQSNTSNQSTTFTDSSSNGHTITVYGNAQHTTDVKKFGSSSILLDGTGDYLKAPLNADFQFGTADFTIDFWFQAQTDPGGSYHSLFHTGSGDGSGLGLIWGVSPSSGVNNSLGTQWGVNGSWEDTSAISGSTYRKNTWYHVAFLRTGTTGKVFIDGVEKYSATRSSNYDANHDGFWIGTWGTSPPGGGSFQGYIDEFRVSKGIARWTSAFTPPTSSYSLSVGSATGTLISDAQTASSSRTSCSGVIMYEDSAGTNTLGTDLKIYFTANNGTNWTEAASYGTATTYSGGKKLVKLGATTVTGGTQIALKAVWANQASGSKVARLHGWAVNY